MSDRVPTEITEAAAEWLDRLSSSDARPDDRQAFSEWVRVSPVHIAEFLRVSALHAELTGALVEHPVSEQLPIDEPQAVVVKLEDFKSERAVDRDGAETAGNSRRHRVAGSHFTRWLSAAAVLAAIVASAFSVLSPEGSRIIATDIGEQRIVLLADGSTLELNTDSEVRVRLSDTRREVELLRGELLVDVAQDTARPFRVLTDEVVVQAIGTRFDVYRRNEATEVIVLEGRVTVSLVVKPALSDQAGIGQAPRELDAGSRLVVKKNARLSWIATVLLLGSTGISAQEIHQQLTLAAQPLAESLQDVAEAFDLKIIFFSDDAKGLDAPALSGSFSAPQAFDALLSHTALEYEYVNGSAVAVRRRQPTAGGDAVVKKPRSMLDRVGVALAAVLIGNAGAVQGAAAEEAGSGVDTTRPIEEIIVTARATEESVREIPVAITAIGERRRDQFGLESFTDLEAITPQLAITRAGFGNGASIAIRGIGSPSSSIGIEQSVAVIIDGVYYPQGRVINEGLFDVSQVAILKGPQALYFGKNSTAGVLSIQTNDPGDELEVSARINNEFETDDLTVEGVISVPVNDRLGLRLAVQASDMDGGWIKNSAVGDDIYTTVDGFTGIATSFVNPRAADIWPKEETLYFRLTAAGDLGDRFSYNVKGSFGRFEQISPSGGSELYGCPTLNGIAHESIPAPVQPPGRPSTLFIPDPRPSVDCEFDGAIGFNNVPPGVAATNPIWNKFGDGSLGEEYESYVLTTTLDWRFDQFDVKAILNFQDQDEHWLGDQDGGAVTSIFVGENNTFENISAEVRAVTQLNHPLNFVLGFYYQETERFFDQRAAFGRAQWTGPVDDPANQFTAYRKISETDGKTVSVYGEAVWDIADRWQLTAGARYIDEDKDSFFYQPYVAPYSFFPFLFKQFEPGNPFSEIVADQNFDDVIPEVTLRWEATDELTLYAAYKEGFKSGGFSNSSILSNLLVPVIGDDGQVNFTELTFDPEENKGGEIGAKASLFDHSMLVTLEVFYYDFKDLHVNFLNSQQFAWVTENAGGSETYGAELQTDWATPVSGLTVSGSVGYLKSKFTEFEAFCFTGQTPAQGCGPLLPGQTETQLRQDLAGNTRPAAPTWSGHVVATMNVLSVVASCSAQLRTFSSRARRY